MSALTDAAGKQAVAQQARPTTNDLIKSQQARIEEQLGKVMDSGAFISAALNEVSKSPELQQATPASLLGAIMLAAQLKLEIGSALGHFWLTPRRDNGVWVCLPIVGYKGFIELAYRTGRVSKIETFLVREGDLFEYGANSERGRFFDWKPLDFEVTRPWTDAVATVKITGADAVIWETLPKDKILGRRPNNWERGPWKGNEEEMSRKTVIREIEPYIPKSTELAMALQFTRQVEDEGQVINSIAGIRDLVATTAEESAAASA